VNPSHIPFPATRQLIQASQGSYTTLKDRCYSGSLLWDCGPGRAGPGRKFSVRAHLYSASSTSAQQAYKDEYRNVLNNKGYDFEYCMVCTNVALVDECIRDLKRGKAIGPDNISAEHLHYAHPSFVIHIKILIQLIVKHSYVPAGFGLGLVIPLVKDKSGNLND